MTDHQPDAPTREGVRLTESDEDAICEALATVCVDSLDANLAVSVTPLYAAVERIVAAHEAAALREAADDWRNEGRAVMFNRNGDDLTPQGRVGKWLGDRADRIGGAR